MMISPGRIFVVARRPEPFLSTEDWLTRHREAGLNGPVGIVWWSVEALTGTGSGTFEADPEDLELELDGRLADFSGVVRSIMS